MKLNALAVAVAVVVTGMPIGAVDAQAAETSETARPRLMLRLEPRYPEAAVKARLSGRVTLEWTIGPNGAQDFDVIESSNPVFDEEVIRTVGVWRYFARAADGTPVLGRRVRETFVFDIEKLEQYDRERLPAR